MIPPFLARLFGDTSIPITPRIDELERAAEDEARRAAHMRHVAQLDIGHGAPRRPALFVEPILPDTPDWYFNGADPSCPQPPEGCGGWGRVSRVIDDVRCWVICECFDESRCV